MRVLSKTVEISADAAVIMRIVADFDAYPQWNEEIQGLWVLARYDDGAPVSCGSTPTTKACSPRSFRPCTTQGEPDPDGAAAR
jgi:hypothetical protein